MIDPVAAYLDYRFDWRPVDATFMGAAGHDHRLPRTGPEAAQVERAELIALQTIVTDAPADAMDAVDRQIMLGEIAVEIDALSFRPRHRNPAWHTGEAGFSIISLLLPQTPAVRRSAVKARLDGIPAFLRDGLAAIGTDPVPTGWKARALSECMALARFLRVEAKSHADWQADWNTAAEMAAAAFDDYASALQDVPGGADPACGADHLTIIMRDVHRLDFGPDEAVRRARALFNRTTDDLVRMACDIDPDVPWEDQVAALSDIGPRTEAEVLAMLQQLDAKAADAATAAGLMTPDHAYALDYRFFPDWAQRISKELYFLFYRSPPALNPSDGSVYWVNHEGSDPAAYRAGHATAMLKTIHAVHHGRVGHHTQNARARQAPGPLARLAGTDCAMGLAFLASGTLIEGWACYVEDLLMEAGDFYTAAERLLLKSFERRNAASILVDVNMHTGAWSTTEAERFYAEEAGFAPARVAGEVVRNSMFPGSRLMYALGVQGIWALRSRWTGSTQDFHDSLLSLGHVPLACVVAEMERRGELRP